MRVRFPSPSPMRIRYDAEVDALYIELRPLEPGIAECRELTDDITADYGADGKLAGLEILDASEALGDDERKVVLELAPVSELHKAARQTHQRTGKPADPA